MRSRSRTLREEFVLEARDDDRRQDGTLGVDAVDSTGLGNTVVLLPPAAVTAAALREEPVEELR